MQHTYKHTCIQTDHTTMRDIGEWRMSCGNTEYGIIENSFLQYFSKSQNSSCHTVDVKTELLLAGKLIYTVT